MEEKIKKNKQGELLKDRRVVEEVNRHLWIESEKAGYDIGFDTAAVDWLERFSKAWTNYHLPNHKESKSKSRTPKTTAKATKKTTRTRTKKTK